MQPIKFHRWFFLWHVCTRKSYYSISLIVNDLWRCSVTHGLWFIDFYTFCCWHSLGSQGARLLRRKTSVPETTTAVVTLSAMSQSARTTNHRLSSCEMVATNQLGRVGHLGRTMAVVRETKKPIPWQQRQAECRQWIYAKVWPCAVVPAHRFHRLPAPSAWTISGYWTHKSHVDTAHITIHIRLSHTSRANNAASRPPLGWVPG